MPWEPQHLVFARSRCVCFDLVPQQAAAGAPPGDAALPVTTLRRLGGPVACRLGRCARLTRKGQRFSSDVLLHRAAAAWDDLVYNVARSLKTLRKRLADEARRRWWLSPPRDRVRR